MARALRIEYPGAFYRVASRGNERNNIFLNARDRQQFLSYLETATVRYGAQIHVCFLMCRLYTGIKLKGIGTAQGVGESAVTQASRRVVLEMAGSESLRKAVGLLVRKLEV